MANLYKHPNANAGVDRLIALAEEPAHKTREAWLNAFVAEAVPMFKQLGHELPSIRVSVGFPSGGARSKSIGECWSKEASGDGTFEIFINPTLEEPSRIADVLTHELVHAAVGLEAKHGKVFGKLARALGLEGAMTATVAGAEWHEWADPIVKRLGAFPHAPMLLQHSGKKKQTTRLIKCECTSCGFTFRTTAKWLENEISCPSVGCGCAKIRIGPIG